MSDSEVLQALNVSLPANVTLTDLLVQLLDGANSTSINGTFLSTPLTGSLLAQRLLFNITSDEVMVHPTLHKSYTHGAQKYVQPPQVDDLCVPFWSVSSHWRTPSCRPTRGEV